MVLGSEETQGGTLPDAGEACLPKNPTSKDSGSSDSTDVQDSSEDLDSIS